MKGGLTGAPWLRCNMRPREGRTASKYLAGIQRVPEHKDVYVLCMDPSDLLRLQGRAKWT